MHFPSLETKVMDLGKKVESSRSWKSRGVSFLVQVFCAAVKTENIFLVIEQKYAPKG